MLILMNCPKCSNDMVETRATNFGEDYWYCRTCKDELKNLMSLEEAKPGFLSGTALTNLPVASDLNLLPSFPTAQQPKVKHVLDLIQDEIKNFVIAYGRSPGRVVLGIAAWNDCRVALNPYADLTLEVAQIIYCNVPCEKERGLGLGRIAARP